MLFVCREAAGSEQAAGEAGIQQGSTSGVQSCQKPSIIEEEVPDVSGFVSEMAAADF